eukprot:Blabericola_migrator_1__11067@NODE_6446_length_533_cov_2_072961_g4394_i0_p2_GENE_NODE_6446_length_533_cov_2_072961_g4394_i0NODE_6446_length_533_cov_2_072961_g4394_i0_p2_ORF_typecomplete_len122_score2_33_NODE_6446_length_533_cov_2_072961_g4394_i0140505
MDGAKEGGTTPPPTWPVGRRSFSHPVALSCLESDCGKGDGRADPLLRDCHRRGLDSPAARARHPGQPGALTESQRGPRPSEHCLAIPPARREPHLARDWGREALHTSPPEDTTTHGLPVRG